MTLVELLQDRGVKLFHHGESSKVTERYVGVECPFCGQGTGIPGLGISLVSGYASCWKCGSRPQAEILAALTRIPLGEAIQLTKGLKRPVGIPGRVKGTLKLPNHRIPLQESPAHEKYLRRRGFDPDEVAKLWGVEALCVHSQYPWRLFIPARLDGEIVSWTTRRIGKVEYSRYVNAPPPEEAYPLRHLLYGEEYARNATVVVEGPLDVWAIGPGAVATLGTGFTRSQLLKISRYPIRAVLFDSEPEAQKRAGDLCRFLEAFPGRTTRVQLETGKDPAESRIKEVRKVRRFFLDG